MPSGHHSFVHISSIYNIIIILKDILIIKKIKFGVVGLNAPPFSLRGIFICVPATSAMQFPKSLRTFEQNFCRSADSKYYFTFLFTQT